MDAALISPPSASNTTKSPPTAPCDLRRAIGEDNAVTLLEQTFEEEKETNQKLSDLASDINVRAIGDAS